MVELIKLIDNGWSISFENVVKRIDGEFVVRATWKAINIADGENAYYSTWGGFEDALDCVKDCVDSLKQVPIR